MYRIFMYQVHDFWEILTTEAKNVFEQREGQLDITSLVHIRRT